MRASLLSRLVRIWLVVALVDGLCASALARFGYGSSVARLWQGVASTVVGPAALEGGARAVALGLLLHLAVALSWSAAFLVLVSMSPRVARTIESPRGVLLVATLLGPCIWLVMSVVVIPMATGRPPTLGLRWWIQLGAHIPFVTLPLVGTTAWLTRGHALDAPVAAAPAPGGVA